LRERRLHVCYEVDLFGSPDNQPNPYVYSYSLEVQQEFGKRDALRIGYYGSLSRKLVRTIDLNRLTPGDTFDNTQGSFQNRQRNACVRARESGLPSACGNREQPFHRIFYALPDVNANYNAMVVNFTHRMDGGLTFSRPSHWKRDTIDTALHDIGFQQTDPGKLRLTEEIPI